MYNLARAKNLVLARAKNLVADKESCGQRWNDADKENAAVLARAKNLVIGCCGCVGSAVSLCVETQWSSSACSEMGVLASLVTVH